MRLDLPHLDYLNTFDGAPLTSDEPLPSDNVYCVPALIRHAISMLEQNTLDLGTISRVIDVRVRVTDPNPWGLRTSDDRNPSGVRLENLEEVLNRWFSRGISQVRLHYQPFSIIPWGDGEGFFQEVSAESDCIVGVALDWRTLQAGAGTPLPHVLKIYSYGGSQAQLQDLSSGDGSPREYEVTRFETSIRVIDGGFLVFRKGSHNI